MSFAVICWAKQIYPVEERVDVSGLNPDFTLTLEFANKPLATEEKALDLAP